MTEPDVWLPERRPNGKWLARWTDADGRPRRTHCDTRDEAMTVTRRHNKGRMRQARPFEARRTPADGVSTRTRFRVLERAGFRCVYCGRGAADVALHVDHVLPIAEGGTSIETNLVAACDDCNLGKSASVIAAPGDTAVILSMQRHIAELTSHAHLLEDLLLVVAVGLLFARAHHGYCEGTETCRGCQITEDSKTLRLYALGMARRPGNWPD